VYEDVRRNRCEKNMGSDGRYAPRVDVKENYAAKNNFAKNMLRKKQVKMLP